MTAADRERAARQGEQLRSWLSTRSAGRAPQVLPPRNAPCLCGSGLKFKRCCADRLSGEKVWVDYGNRIRAFLKESNFKGALYVTRAYLTVYTIWHKSHTEPAIRTGFPLGRELLETDIRALASLVDDLMLCHIKTNMIDEFPAVLERLRNNINDPNWQRKITYFHALHALWPDWNREAGRRELKKLGSIADEKDEEILQLYLDLFGDHLTFSQEYDIIERILNNSESFSDRLHYKAAKAVLFLTIGDRHKSDEELSEVVAEARERCKKAALSEYERYRFAQTVQLLGMLRGDDTLLTEALDLYQELLKEDYWTCSGRADLLKLKGDTYRGKQEWESARQCYLQAFGANPSPIYKVFLSQCLVQLGQLEEAAKTFAEIKPEELSAPANIDYTFALAGFAIEIGDRNRLEDAKAKLKALPIKDPYFREQRDSLLLIVQEAFTMGSSLPLIQRSRRLIAGLARFVSTYLFIRPSIMGMGVDVGKILEDFSKRSERISKLRDDR
jgi:tetratricopeptide (TPR) repeat protein